MINLSYDNSLQRGDLTRLVNGLNLDTDEGLRTAITISFLTDARAKPSDGLPPEQDPRGWWGSQFLEDRPDLELGSRLWLLRRMKLNDASLRLSGVYGKESLLWMQPNVARNIYVTPARIVGVINAATLTVQVERPKKLAPRFEDKWRIEYGL